MDVDLYSQLELFSDKEDQLKDAAIDLQNWGCCSRCVLRYLGEQEIDPFRNLEVLEKWLSSWCPAKDTREENVMDKEKEQNHENTEEPSSTDDNVVQSSKPCVVCLGVLETKYCDKSFLDEVIEIVRKENYEISSFTPALSFTVIVMLREHAMWIALKDKHKSAYYGRKPEEVMTIKEIWKELNGPYLVEQFGVPMEVKNKGKLEIKMNFQHLSTNAECSFLLDVCPNIFRKRKTQNERRGLEVFSRIHVTTALNEMSEAKFKRSYSCPPRKLKLAMACHPITSSHEALYMAGRYNKSSRELPQTPWVVDGKRKMETSVQEIICELLQSRSRSEDYKFSTSGREDIDVRCLGNGRPFLIEFINPHKVNFEKSELKELQDTINKSTDKVAIRHLQVVTSEETLLLKEGEEEKTKSYSALCWTDTPITQEYLNEKLSPVKDLTLKQKTPIRVLHRRSVAVREKVVHSCSAKLIDDRHFHFYLKTQAGTYIKEFVHGDFGRTVPSLGSLLERECDILELDVESVDLDWPPPVQYDEIMS